MICSGFGHSDCPNISDALDKAISQAIEMGCDIFYCGCKGSFDSQFASATLRAKQKNNKIKVYYVSPNVITKSNKNYYSQYDGIIVPELESVPYRFKILKRNEWIVKESQHIIFYIDHSFGGANQAYEYAKRKKKNFINLAKNIPT